MCPNIRVIEENGTERIENTCSAGLRCPWAHSKEEVLFHPHIFKTTLCEEHNTNTSSNPKSRNGKKNRCHRYYCPFAHGSEELRTSPLPKEQKESCIRAMEVFPSDVCCMVCTRHWLNPPVTDKQQPQGYQEPAGLNYDVNGAASMLWGSQKSPQQPPIFQPPFDVLSTVPNQGPPNLMPGDLGARPPKDMFGKMDKAVKDHASVSPIQKPTEDPFAVAYKPDLLNPSFFNGEPLSSLRVSTLSRDSPAFIDRQQPAFIDLANDGYSVGQRNLQAAKPPLSTQPRDLLGEFYYATL